MGFHNIVAHKAAPTLQPLTETEYGTQSELYINHKERPICGFYSS